MKIIKIDGNHRINEFSKVDFEEIDLKQIKSRHQCLCHKGV